MAPRRVGGRQGGTPPSQRPMRRHGGMTNRRHGVAVKSQNWCQGDPAQRSNYGQPSCRSYVVAVTPRRVRERVRRFRRFYMGKLE